MKLTLKTLWHRDHARENDEGFLHIWQMIIKQITKG